MKSCTYCPRHNPTCEACRDASDRELLREEERRDYIASLIDREHEAALVAFAAWDRAQDNSCGCDWCEATVDYSHLEEDYGDAIARSAENLRTMDPRFSGAPATD